MNYKFHPEAEEELNRQVDYYEDKQSGLGKDFLKEILVAISRVMNNPTAWQIVDRHYRRCLTDRFPFAIVYRYDKEKGYIRIVAVMSQRQKPKFWIDRKF